MPAQVQEVSVADQVIDLADSYATTIIREVGLDPHPDLQQSVAGALLEFLDDVMAVSVG